MNEENEMRRNTEHVDSLKNKLNTVTSEIDALKNSFTRGAEELTRIQTMLNVESLEEITGMLERYENQVADAERKRIEAAEGAKKYREELDKEKERLVKLWDAYKNQEEELTGTEKRISDYEERVRRAEAEKKQLEDDLTARINTLTERLEENQAKAQRFDEYQQRMDEVKQMKDHLETEVSTLREQINQKDETIAELNNQIDKYKQYQDFAEYKDKYESVAAEYEKEKERLTKLYQLYEDTDMECKKLRDANQEWQNWFDSNKEVFDKLFSAAPPVGGMNPNMQMTNEPPTNNEEPTDENKSKGKLGGFFKKK